VDNTPDLWEEQIARLLRSYRDPVLPGERLREIGDDIARRLAETGAVEANLHAVLPHYKEPEIDADRLAQIGRELASRLQPAAEKTPRSLRAVRRPRSAAPSSRAPLMLGLAAAAALLIAVLAGVFSEKPAPRSPREEAKMPRVREETPEEVPPPPPPRDEPKPPAPPPRPKAPDEKPKEAPRPPEPETPPAPAPAPRPEPAPRREEAPKPTVPAVVEVARLERVQGDVFLMSDAGRTPAKTGDPIPPGRGLQTDGRESSAVVRYADGTLMDIGPDTVLKRFDEGDKKLAVVQGTITAQVPRQPAGHPMILTTPLAESKVVGTKFTLWARPDWTRLEVKEGRVRFTRLSDGTSADVGPDQVAIASAGPKPVARRAPPAALPKGLYLVEDFEDPLSVETKWQPLEGGLPLSTLGLLELDLSPRAGESYAAGGWHLSWGLRTREYFPAPCRVSLDVEQTQKHLNANALVVLIPKGQPQGTSKNEIAVHLRAEQYGILIGGQPAKTVDRPWTPPLKERWTIELDRREIRLSADGRAVLRHPHGLQLAGEYRLELQGGGKMDTPAGARVRYDNVRIEP
jgi:periplasmic protein TonB